MEFKDRLKQLRLEKKVSQDELAKVIGVSKQTIYNYESGARKRMSDEALKKVSDYFNVTIDYLMGNSDERKSSGYTTDDVITTNIYKIPVYQTVAAGLGAYADDYIVGYEFAHIENPFEAQNTVFIRVSGDSMSPQIEDGDLIQVRKQSSVSSGEIAVILIDGEEGVIKQFFYDDGFVELRSFNPSYPPRTFHGREINRLRIFGKVMGSLRKF